MKRSTQGHNPHGTKAFQSKAVSMEFEKFFIFAVGRCFFGWHLVARFIAGPHHMSTSPQVLTSTTQKTTTQTTTTNPLPRCWGKDWVEGAENTCNSMSMKDAKVERSKKKQFPSFHFVAVQNLLQVPKIEQMMTQDERPRTSGWHGHEFVGHHPSPNQKKNVGSWSHFGGGALTCHQNSQS